MSQSEKFFAYWAAFRHTAVPSLNQKGKEKFFIDGGGAACYNRSMDKKMRYKMTVRFFGESEKCFGPGIAALLHRVQELHSLRAAAGSMSMAYSKAWMVLRTAEGQLGYKLLHSTTGGRGGGGATLTPEGEELLRRYDTFCERLEEYGDELFEELFPGAPEEP